MRAHQTRQDLHPHYDVVLVGSGFASSFFLHGLLRHAPAGFRALVIERGPFVSERWRRENRRRSPMKIGQYFERAGDPHKDWAFTIGFGGSSNCWWGNTPRMLPEDFEMHARYGVLRDWPVSYDALEPFYDQAEQLMAIAGDGFFAPTRPANGYPQPPHRLSDAQQALAQAQPGLFGPMPTARASAPGASRPVCCANGVCDRCPISAKFSIANGLNAPYDDSRVHLLLEHDVTALCRNGGAVNGVQVSGPQGDFEVAADTVALGANALFNPAILMRSGFEHPLLGARLHEQIGVTAEIKLNGLKNFNGSSSVTGVGYMGYAGAHRRTGGACMLEAWNIGNLRADFGRWQEVMEVRLVIEDEPLEQNRVKLGASGVVADFHQRSDYGLRGVARAREQLGHWLGKLPVEAIELAPDILPSESHIMGTTVMGTDAESSVTDAWQRLHGHNNVFVLGSSGFPTGAPANPTLTIAALSLRAATRYF